MAALSGVCSASTAQLVAEPRRGAASILSSVGAELAGRQLAVGSQVRCESRVTCKAVLLPPATARLDLLADLERRWLKVHEEPDAEAEERNAEFNAEFERLLDKYEYNFDVGQKVEGLIFQADLSGASVDIGAKGPAFLPANEASIYKIRDMSTVGVYAGAQCQFEVINARDHKGRIIISLRKMQQNFAWERCRQLLADDVTVFGTVLSMNRGGLIVHAEGVRGFVPMSLVASPLKATEMISHRIALKFIEVDEERARLVMSNRRAMTENQVQAFHIGDVVLGTVQSVKPYGAFVDVGGVNGLLHISQISHERVTNVETLIQEGDQLKVMILSHDRDKGRLGLSTKRLEPTPGDMLRNPQLVFEKAESMAAAFRERVAAAEEHARQDEARMQSQGLFFPAAVGAGMDQPADVPLTF